jgi:hypothetical protein
VGNDDVNWRNTWPSFTEIEPESLRPYCPGRWLVTIPHIGGWPERCRRQRPL